ncbi:NYN domain-containing protein [Helicobacter typhlonius]|uniref:NYN domain-containing protein n=2 Tax=Helicobacter typhlonius TaxID=76936 RepID=A0A0S4PVI0_9HELI|nr:NYN domain-containing protein [Helicobacter typhlonius]TLD79622.1 NYN domain-containing protein [Helicobacter typhlonius]CUU39234.1 putative [Helicobacter typhlonius]
MKKVVVFIDWENLRLDIHNIQRTHKERKNITFNYNNVSNISFLIKQFIDIDKEEISKIFFYTALPLSDEEINKELSRYKKKNPEIFKKILEYNEHKNNSMGEIRQKIIDFVKHIAFEDYFAVRLGELKLSGFDSNGKPIINQKQVDMLLGLDISHIAYQKLADKAMVFCKDTDIIPALKCARTNGLEVVIASLKEGYKIADKLKKHSDIIREKSLLEVSNALKIQSSL